MAEIFFKRAIAPECSLHCGTAELESLITQTFNYAKILYQSVKKGKNRESDLDAFAKAQSAAQWLLDGPLALLGDVDDAESTEASSGKETSVRSDSVALKVGPSETAHLY